MHPLVYIVGAFASMVAFVILGAVAVDNWTAGNRAFATVASVLAALAAWTVNASMEGAAEAYQVRLEAADASR